MVSMGELYGSRQTDPTMNSVPCDLNRFREFRIHCIRCLLWHTENHMKLRLIGTAIVCSALAACASQPSPPYSNNPPPYSAPSQIRCYDCGRVERIESVYGARQNTHTGAILGGIVGGVLGNQVGKGDGKKAATVAGVVGGAIAGNAIEKKVNETTFDVTVRMDNGNVVIINQNSLPSGLQVGSAVRVSNGRIIAQ
jgi:outer membrane lipoprotein SlyB